MRALIKLPLLMLLCFSAVEAVTSSSAWAGDAGTTPPDSGGLNLDGSFAPGTDNDNASDNNDNVNNGTPAAINAAIANVVASLSGERPTIESPVTGEVLTPTETQAATIVAALTATGSDVQPALAALEQQLSAELGVLGIDIDIVGATPPNLTAAIASANALVNSLSSTELANASRSPTFAALRQILAARRGNGRRDVTAGTGGGIPVLNRTR